MKEIVSSFLVVLVLFMTPVLLIITTSWLVMWGLIEINIISFTSFDVSKDKRSSKNLIIRMIKYFIIQTIASTSILLCVLLNNYFFLLYLLYLFITLLLVLKIASSPIHRWFLDVIKSLNWLKAMILITWQKFIPIVVLRLIRGLFLWVFVFFCATLTSIEILRKKVVLEVIALSSVFNNSWAIVSTQLSFRILLLFTILYWVAVISFILEIFRQFNILKIFKSNGLLRLLFLLNISSLPPTTGFLAKWFVLIKIVKIGQVFQLTVLILTSIVNVFAYVRISSLRLLEWTVNKKVIHLIIKLTILVCLWVIYSI